MTEAEAITWLSEALDVPRGTHAKLRRFVDHLREEGQRQNLISAATMGEVWSRHIVDSAQLLRWAGEEGSWLDLGSGAGFPGLIVAALGRHQVTLVEPRRKRVAFLAQAAAILEVEDRVTIAGCRAETLEPATFDVISARAFAPLDKLLSIGARFAGPGTQWLLPKGRQAQAELDTACRTWQGRFRIEPSVTDPASAIIVAEQVRRKGQR